MKTHWRLAAGLAVAVGGCTVSQMASEGVVSFPYANCGALTAEQAAFKWEEADRIDIVYENDSFSNGLLEMSVGKPVVLRVTNGGEKLNWFRADGFFPTVSFNRVRYDGVGVDSRCPDSVGIALSKTVEFQLVPNQEGVYQFTEGSLNAPFMSELFVNNALGYIYVR